MIARGSLSLLAVTAVLATAKVASAQEQAGYAANHFNPSERGSRWFVLDSVDIQGHGRLALGLVDDYSARALVSYRSDGVAEASVIRNQYIAHLGGSVVLADRLRLGMGVPLQLFADGHAAVINGVTHRPAEETTVGDVRLSLDGRIFRAASGKASLAAGVSLFAPSGSTASYTGDGKPRIEPHVAYAGHNAFMAYALRVGVLFRGRDEAFGDGYIGTSVNGGLSAGALLAGGKLLVGPEIFGSTVVSDGRAFEGRTTPLEALLGAHYDVGANVRVGAGVGAGLTRAYGAPVARGLLSIEWVPGDAKPEATKVTDDRDGDGVPDTDDACGFVRGTPSTDPTRNGCPLDTDADGVPDERDACPQVPGAPSADASANGCPQDTDRDGVPDVEDACAQQPGKRSADPRRSGCPDHDADGDGVPDALDACPDRAGPATADPKTSGCPGDRDGDGVPDDTDACPDQPGKADPDKKRNGCPMAVLKDNVIVITNQVKFKTGSAEITAGKENDDLLGAVVDVLKAHPELKALRVEGHTDNTGEAAANKRLSQARAEAVARWLSGHGIDKARLSAVGLGAERPIDSNSTEPGRTNNRRVEFHVEQGSVQ